MDNKYKFYANMYWKLWFVLISAYFLGKIFKIYLLKDITYIPYFSGIFIILGIIHAVSGVKFSNYLKKNHYEKWKELNTIPGLGLGFSNGVRQIDFFFSKDSLNDPIVIKFKSECKKIMLLTLVHFILMPIFLVVLTVLHINDFIILKLI